MNRTIMTIIGLIITLIAVALAIYKVTQALD